MYRSKLFIVLSSLFFLFKPAVGIELFNYSGAEIGSYYETLEAAELDYMSPIAVKADIVNIDIQAMQGDDEMTVSMPDGMQYEAVVSGMQNHGNDNISWRGKLISPYEEKGHAAIMVVDGVTAAYIKTPNATYVLQPKKSGESILLEIDPSLYPEDELDYFIDSDTNFVKTEFMQFTEEYKPFFVATEPDGLEAPLEAERAQMLAEQINGLLETLLAQVVGRDVVTEISLQDKPGEESASQDSSPNGGASIPPDSSQEDSGQSSQSCDGSGLDLPLSRWGEELQQLDKNGDGVWGDPLKDARGEYPVQREAEMKKHGTENRKEMDGITFANAILDTMERNADEDFEVAFDAYVDALFEVLNAEAAYEEAVQDAINASPEDVDEATENAEALREKADAAKKKADDARKKVEDSSDPDLIGGGSPCEDQDWFRQSLPQLVGTRWDPYAKQNALSERDPSNPCGPQANPGPDGECSNESDAGDEGSPSTVELGLTPDCDDVNGCGRPTISEARAAQITQLEDPNNTCGPTANTGPDGDCGNAGTEGEEELGTLGPDPDCKFCLAGQVPMTRR